MPRVKLLPAWGAGIEISLRLAHLRAMQLLLIRGVWIEMSVLWGQRWFVVSPWGSYQLLPCCSPWGGAWIEIREQMAQVMYNARCSPYGECGLK